MIGNPLTWMGVTPLLDGAKQFGRGVIGAVAGQTYNVQRLTSGVSGSITNAPYLYQNLGVSFRRITTRSVIENATFDLLVYEGKCDIRYHELGDLFTETGFRSDGGAFTLVQMRPLRQNVFMRTESPVTITRPRPSGGRTSQQPISGSVVAPGYVGLAKAGEQVLTLQDGLYSFVDGAANPAVVRCGIQMTSRVRDGSRNDAAGSLPTELYRAEFWCYVPLLPGEMLTEIDRLNFGNCSDRYQIASMLTTDNTGVSGYIIKVEKLGT